MNKILIPWLAAASAALLLTAPATADTTADVQKCRTALAAEGHFDNSLQSLKFAHRKGNTRKRTVYMTMENRGNGTRQQIACRLERQDIVGLTLIPKT